MQKNLPHLFKMQKQILQKSSYKILQHTMRLKQIQGQLEMQKYKAIQQQYISSKVMKHNAFKKLTEQQDLLIIHLKQQIRSLEKWSGQSLRLKQSIENLQSKYLMLDMERCEKIQLDYQTTNKLQMEYKTLHQLLKQLSEQSVKKYEFILRLQQKHVILRQQLKKINEAYIQVRSQYQVSLKIKTLKIKQKQNFKKQIEKQNQIKCQEQQKRGQSSSLLSKNNERLAELQLKIGEMQSQKEKLLKVSQAAQNDNMLLKESLKDSIMRMKIKEQELMNISKQKQNLKSKLQEQKQNLQKVVKRSAQSMKVNFQQVIVQSDRQNNTYENFVHNKFRAQIQIDKLNFSLDKQNQQKSFSLINLQQSKEQLRKHFYFIEQYMVLNSELIREIQILIQQDIHKQIIRTNYRSNFHAIQSINNFLERAQFEMQNNSHLLRQLKQSSKFYNIQI